ncbi:MAG: hypothetical protein N4J56_001063 [Chroococcidiopsis sp. SAG 2025]|uniref:hypothetical protein n=1 Tax=Chroococcidiopsis sp. SAG 2025 TaxID=171389 RepID=UPI00293729F5|nr:hypothetical protein [Chroococcidiopsis sp. SAG 2025]MDV2991409.1 hypothetical protein [Chroococcidiopsis sp. SAG 2025]
MNNQKNRNLLLALLIINAISTMLHYTDNFIFYDKYPQPSWITSDSIYLAWLGLTMFGVVGYMLYVKGIFWAAYVCLGIYSITGISSPGHYLYSAQHVFSGKMHLLIWTDAIAGISLLIFILRSALVLKEWRKEPKVSI